MGFPTFSLVLENPILHPLVYDEFRALNGVILNDVREHLFISV